METDVQLLLIYVSSFPQQVELAASGAKSSNVSENPETNWEIIKKPVCYLFSCSLLFTHIFVR